MNYFVLLVLYCNIFIVYIISIGQFKVDIFSLQKVLPCSDVNARLLTAISSIIYSRVIYTPCVARFSASYRASYSPSMFRKHLFMFYGVK